MLTSSDLKPIEELGYYVEKYSENEITIKPMHGHDYAEISITIHTSVNNIHPNWWENHFVNIQERYMKANYPSWKG